MSGSSKGYYAKVKGTFWRHDRTSSLSLAARGLWVSLLSWSSDQASDGAISARGLEMAAGLRADKESVRSHAKALEELLSAELLVRVGNAFQLRDWTQHNITKAQYETQKEAVKKRVNKSRGKVEVTRDESPDDAPLTPDVTRYKPATEQVTKPLPSDQDQDQDQDQDRELLESAESARPTSTVAALRVGYQTRYQARTSDAWMTHAADDGAIKRVGVWCDEQANPAEAVERFLDGAFANPSASMAKNRWPWKWLAEDPARTASFSTVATGALNGHPTLAASQKAAVGRIPTFTQEELANARV